MSPISKIAAEAAKTKLAAMSPDELKQRLTELQAKKSSEWSEQEGLEHGKLVFHDLDFIPREEDELDQHLKQVFHSDEPEDENELALYFARRGNENDVPDAYDPDAA